VFLPYYFNLKTKRNGFEQTRKCRKCTISVENNSIPHKGLNPFSTLSTLSTPIFEKKIILKKYGGNTIVKSFLLTMYGIKL